MILSNAGEPYGTFVQGTSEWTAQQITEVGLISDACSSQRHALARFLKICKHTGGMMPAATSVAFRNGCYKSHPVAFL